MGQCLKQALSSIIPSLAFNFAQALLKPKMSIDKPPAQMGQLYTGLHAGRACGAYSPGLYTLFLLLLSCPCGARSFFRNVITTLVLGPPARQGVYQALYARPV